jgi:hypothetical protein
MIFLCYNTVKLLYRFDFMKYEKDLTNIQWELIEDFLILKIKHLQFIVN